MSRLKVAIVNQPIDSILPPIQSSIGACTYGAARSLARECDVTVYGLREVGSHATVPTEYVEDGVRYRFIEPPGVDRKLRRLYDEIWGRKPLVSAFAHSMKPPISSSRLSRPLYGLSVATDLRRRPADVVHIQHSSQYVYAISRLNPESKILLHLHAELFPQNNLSLMRRRVRRADHLSGVSDYVAERVCTALSLPRSACTTIYNGIDVDEFVRASRDASTEASDSQRVILYAGGISPHKGIHVLIDAFVRVAEAEPDVKLQVVGPPGAYPVEETFALDDTAVLETMRPFYESDYSRHLDSLVPAALADRIEFAGAIPRDELVRRYLAADVFAFPSIWDEGFGIPPVEAMAAGVPVVATRSGAVPETVRDGETGILVDKHDPAGLAQALLRVLRDRDLRDRLGAAGRRRAFEQFSWDAAAASMLRTYEQLVAPRRTLRDGGPHAGDE
jgi:glycosyltransferase involved in cell wall biosynthesis